MIDLASMTLTKSILNAVVVIIVIIWLLQAFGILGSLGNVRVK